MSTNENISIWELTLRFWNVKLYTYSLIRNKRQALWINSTGACHVSNLFLTNILRFKIWDGVKDLSTSVVWSLITNWCIDPCDIHYAGRRNNTIYLLRVIKSIVMLKYLCVVILLNTREPPTGLQSPDSLQGHPAAWAHAQLVRTTNRHVDHWC